MVGLWRLCMNTRDRAAIPFQKFRDNTIIIAVSISAGEVVLNLYPVIP